MAGAIGRDQEAERSCGNPSCPFIAPAEGALGSDENLSLARHEYKIRNKRRKSSHSTGHVLTGICFEFGGGLLRIPPADQKGCTTVGTVHRGRASAELKAARQQTRP
jgi:hypothetical protein